MTLWQFYAVFFVQCLLGVAVCAAMFWLGARCPILNWKPAPWAEKWRYRIMGGLIILAGIASYETLPSLVQAFTEDISTVIAEETVNLGEKAIRGEDISTDLDLAESLRESTTGVIWGEQSNEQKKALGLMAGFWLTLAWCIYSGNFAKSPSSWWQKLLKIIGYPPLTSILVIWPLQLHQLDFAELKMGLTCLGIASVCIVASHDYSSRPPELPSTVTGRSAHPKC